ncbi:MULTISPECIES: Wzz/FepE/Etk N-terminal domain-containing protein [unclassified Roseitalea]|uniref:GumC family protein n=1 Tax=unclassified Roseitalea TaxID=2639107 RepID=UPI00273EE2D2|nr:MULTISPECIES: Wzz/FepE/Etk N-terminal domain-containing protein [unclassified Roseitalea]
MSATSYQSRDADIDIGWLFAALWRDKWFVLGGALGLAALVFFGLSLLTPQYRTDARVLIDAGESVFTRPEGDTTGDRTRLDQEAVASQVQIITSSDLLLQVADELDLSSLSEFNEGADGGLFGLFGFGSATPGVLADKRVLAVLRERLTVYPVDNSRVIVIEFRSADPELAARVPNALARAYVALESRAQLQGTQAAADYLAAEIAELEQGVREAEQAIAEFRAASGLLMGDNATVLATQQLAELSSELSRVRADRSSLEARVRSVESALAGGAALDTLPDVIASPLIVRLSEQEATRTAQLADLSTTLLPGHPRIQALRSQIADLQAQKRAQAERVLAGLRNEARIAREREQEINAELNTLKAASAQANEREVELRALERQAQSQRALLESYLVRFREAQSRDEGQYAPASARLISSATVPIEPAFPRLVPMTAAAFVGGLLLMVLITLLRELFSGRALVPAAQAAPVAGDRPGQGAISAPPPSVPAARPGRGDATPRPASQGRGPANDNFTIDAVTGALIRRGAGRVLVVAPIEGAADRNGVDLARRIDAKGLRSILVDLTGTGTAGAHMLEDPLVPGINDLLAADASYHDVIHPDRASRAHVVPAGLIDPERALAGIDRLPGVLDGLASVYDIVVVDCGMTDAQGLRALVSTDAELVLSIDETVGERATQTARDLAENGFDDLLILVADSDGETGPDGGETVEDTARAGAAGT